MLISPRTMHDRRRTYDLDGLGNWKMTVFDPVGGSDTTQIRQHNSLSEIASTKDGASAKVDFSYCGASNGTTDYLYHGAVAQSQLARGHVRSKGAAYRAIRDAYQKVFAARTKPRSSRAGSCCFVELLVAAIQGRCASREEDCGGPD